VFIIRFLRFLKNTWDGEEPPESWLKAIIIPVHKKGNIKHCENHRGINLLNSGCKLYTNIKNKLYTYYKNITGEEQNRFTVHIIKTRVF
jgi:hypothetical protein